MEPLAILYLAGVFLVLLAYQVQQHLPWPSTVPTWCQGCDTLTPTSSMKFTEIGLYRCDICRTPEKVIKPKKTSIADDRVKMQALAREINTTMVSQSAYRQAEPVPVHNLKTCRCAACQDQRERMCVICGYPEMRGRGMVYRNQHVCAACVVEHVTPMTAERQRLAAIAPEEGTRVKSFCGEVVRIIPKTGVYAQSIEFGTIQIKTGRK